jgi:hypothetical protein
MKRSKKSNGLLGDVADGHDIRLRADHSSRLGVRYTAKEER